MAHCDKRLQVHKSDRVIIIIIINFSKKGELLFSVIFEALHLGLTAGWLADKMQVNV